MNGYPDDAYAYADEAFFSAWVTYEKAQALRDELDDDTAEWNGYDPAELDTDELETLIDYEEDDV